MFGLEIWELGLLIFFLSLIVAIVCCCISITSRTLREIERKEQFQEKLRLQRERKARQIGISVRKTNCGEIITFKASRPFNVAI